MLTLSISAGRNVTGKQALHGIEAAIAQLSRVHRYNDNVTSRNLVVVSPVAPTVVVPAATNLVLATRPSTVSLYWLSAPLQRTFDAATKSIGWENDPRSVSIAKAGAALADAIKARRSLTFRAGVCLDAIPSGAIRLSVKTAATRAECSVYVSDWSAVADNRARCSAEDIAEGAYPYADSITLSFSAEQESDFSSKRAFLDGSYEEGLEAKGEFFFRAAFGDGLPIDARAHFRGSSTFRECPRKSFTVRLTDGEKARRLQPGSAGDRFELGSICEDYAYVKVRLSASLFRAFAHTRLRRSLSTRSRAPSASTCPRSAMSHSSSSMQTGRWRAPASIC